MARPSRWRRAPAGRARTRGTRTRAPARPRPNPTTARRAHAVVPAAAPRPDPRSGRQAVPSRPGRAGQVQGEHQPRNRRYVLTSPSGHPLCLGQRRLRFAAVISSSPQCPRPVNPTRRVYARGLHSRRRSDQSYCGARPGGARSLSTRACAYSLEPPGLGRFHIAAVGVRYSRSYSSWRRYQTPDSLRPSGARSSHWYMAHRTSIPRSYAE